jgi:glucosylglycerate synthase
LAEDSFLTDDLLRQLISVGEVDLLVGVLSQNNADTIGHTVEAIEESFQKAFPRQRVVIVDVDAGSSDGTTDIFLSSVIRKNANSRGLTSLRTEQRVVTRFENASPATVFRTIIATADLLRARACAVVSAATPNLNADLVGNLLQPVYRQDFDYVAPLYARQRFDGLLARTLLYPMTRAVFGKRIRETYSTEFAFSGRLATNCTNLDIWHEPAIQDLPQACMVVTAITSDYRCCQSFLGPKLRPSLSATADIVTAVRQAVGALFWCIETQESYWTRRSGSELVPSFGSDHELTDEPVSVNLDRIFDLFRSGVAELSPILKTIAAPDTYAEIQRLATLDARNLCFDNALWVRTLYDFAASYHHTLLNRDHLVQALVPLYRGKIYSFFRKHAASSPEDIEADSESLCLEFERQKPHLIERWKVRSEVTS